MDIKKDIRQMVLAAGAHSCGFARAEAVDEVHWDHYQQWIASGCNGSMDYCGRYADVRRDPRLLIYEAGELGDGVSATVISCAFSYNTTQRNPLIASYALGLDYHYVIKQRLMAVADEICSRYGGKARVTVDSAPIMEKYWAVRAGIGFQGRNGLVIIPGAGSFCFLAEIIWSGEVEADAPCALSCGDCRRCERACPGQAIQGHGSIDARRCVSYLTIEHRGALPADANLGGSIYGCDKCQLACPHNGKAPASEIAEFAPRPEMLSLDRDALLSITPSQYKKLVAHSAMRRVPLSRLKANMKAGQRSATGE